MASSYLPGWHLCSSAFLCISFFGTQQQLPLWYTWGWVDWPVLWVPWIASSDYLGDCPYSYSFLNLVTLGCGLRHEQWYFFFLVFIFAFWYIELNSPPLTWIYLYILTLMQFFLTTVSAFLTRCSTTLLYMPAFTCAKSLQIPCFFFLKEFLFQRLKLEDAVTFRRMYCFLSCCVLTVIRITWR